MKVFLQLDGIKMKSISNLEIVDDKKDADVIISDSELDEFLPCIVVESVDLSNAVEIDGIGYVPKIDFEAQDYTLFVDTLAVKPEKVSFEINGGTFALKEYKPTRSGDVKVELVVGGEDVEVVLKVGAFKGIAIPVGADAPVVSTPKGTAPSIKNGDMSDIALNLLEDIDDTEMNSTVHGNLYQNSTPNNPNNPKPVEVKETKIVESVDEIKSEDDLLMYADGLFSEDEP